MRAIQVSFHCVFDYGVDADVFTAVCLRFSGARVAVPKINSSLCLV